MVKFKGTFWVEGIPKPGGSKTVFPCKGKKGKYVVVDACKGNKKWRESVAAQVRKSYHGEPLTTPLCVDFYFYMPRPKCHYTAKGKLKPNAPAYHTVKPDKGKLERSTTDALTGILWKDDAQIVTGTTEKNYVSDTKESPSCLIRLEEI